MKVLCYSVRLSSLTSISEKAYKAVAFDGSEAIIPKSQVLGFAELLKIKTFQNHGKNDRTKIAKVSFGRRTY